MPDAGLPRDRLRVPLGRGGCLRPISIGDQLGRGRPRPAHQARV